MKTYKQRTDSILKKAERQKSIRKKVTISAIAATACAALTAFSLVLFTPFKVPENPINAYKNDEYFSVIKPLNAQFEKKSDKPVYKNNFEKWTAELKNLFSSDVKGGASGGELNGAVDDSADIAFPEFDFEVNGGDTGSVPGIGNEDTGASGSGNGGYVETTDNQVAGVIEGDLIKRTKTHAFQLCYWNEKGYLQEDLTVRVYTIAGEQSKLVSQYTIQGVIVANKQRTGFSKIFLTEDGKTLTVIIHYRSASSVKKFTEVITLDVSNPLHIKKINKAYLSGDSTSVRSVNGKLFVFNKFTINAMPDFDDPTTYVPQYSDNWLTWNLVDAENIVVPEKITSELHTVVMQIDQQSGKIEDCIALYGGYTNSHFTKENMYSQRTYTAEEDGEEMTEITCFSYGNGDLKKQGSVVVEGAINKPYSMDEYNGIFRVVTTVYTPYTSASIYCVDLDTWQVVGSVENFSPEGEDVQSVRFDKEKAFVCTAEIKIIMTDPVYVFNLSDPKNITYVDTGTMDGYSSSLIQLSDGIHCIGIGKQGGNDWETEDNLKVDIYRETESKLEIVATYTADATFASWYQCYFINRKLGLVGIPVFKKTGWEYVVLHWDGENLTELCTVEIVGRGPLFPRAFLDEDTGYFYVLNYDIRVVNLYEKMQTSLS